GRGLVRHHMTLESVDLQTIVGFRSAVSPEAHRYQCDQRSEVEENMQRFREWCRRNARFVPATLCFTGVMAGAAQSRLFALECWQTDPTCANGGPGCTLGSSYFGGCDKLYTDDGDGDSSCDLIVWTPLGSYHCTSATCGGRPYLVNCY